ncbi:MAG: ankyrin repeat domain-containing protein [Planctomycetota bacterium]|jgi:choloylglycine hydrolase
MVNEPKAFARLMCLLTIIMSLTSVVSRTVACSTVMLKREGILLTGHNLDESTDFEGFVCVNKRDYYKVGSTWSALKTYSKYLPYSFNWISRYGSITWSSQGRDLPDAGVNEAGLVIEEMSLANHPYPPVGIRPRLFQMQWIQYHLDTCSTVEQVIRSASLIFPDGWPWHFFVADKSGNCATLEYVENKLVIHTGETLPVTALCNSTYEEELTKLNFYEGFGGRKAIELNDKTIPRFVRAAHMLNSYNPETQPSAVDYVFNILENLSSNLTRRSYVVDLTNEVVYFRTSSRPEIRHFSLKSFDFSCNYPVQILDLNVHFSGEVTNKFQDYTLQANHRVAESWVNHVMDMHPDATLKDGIEAGFTPEHIDRYARYPSLSLAKSDLETENNEYGLTDLHWAAYQGDLQQVRGLLKNDIDVNVTTGTGTTPLMAAAQAGHLDVVRQLVDSGAGIDLADKRGNTPLITAVVFGQSDVAADLIQTGAKVQLANKSNLGPLHYSAANGDLYSTKLLLAKGADMEAKSELGWTALISAAFSGRPEVVKYLFSKGANLNAVDQYGNTALLVALLLKHSDVAEELIEAGSDVQVENSEGKTPWALASTAENKKVMRLLKEAGVEPPHNVLPIVVVISVVSVLALFAYAIASWKRRTDTSSNAVGPKHICSGRTILMYAAILLNSIQVVVGILFVTMKGLPQEAMEWVLLVMWFIVPMVNFMAVVLLGRKG